MSVLEIAKAFDAPLLREVDHNGSAEEHLRAVGKTRVRYGFETQSVVQEKDGNNDQQGHQSPHLNAAPQLDMNLIEVDCEAEDSRFQQYDTISIISEATTNDPPGNCDQLKEQQLKCHCKWIVLLLQWRLITTRPQSAAAGFRQKE